MPFPPQVPMPFTRSSVQRLAGGLVGCYGLSKANTWIYIGKGEIRSRLLAHLDGDIPCLLRYGATHFVIEETVRLDSREKELISEFDPVCNQRLG